MYHFRGKGAFARSRPFSRSRGRSAGGVRGAGAVLGLLSSLRTRLFLLVLLALLPALGLALYTFVDERGRSRAQARETALHLTQLAAASQAELFEGTRTLLVALAQLPEVRGGEPEACGALLAKVLAQYRSYTSFGVVDPDGDVVCSAVPPPGRVNVADEPWFRRAVASGDFVVGEYQIGDITGRAVIVLGYPIHDGAGEVQAVLGAGLDLAALNRVAAKAELSPGAALTIVDSGGTVLARFPDPERWIGRSLPAAPLVSTMLTRRQGVAEMAGLDGVRRLYAFAPVALAYDVYVSSGTSLPVAYADANSDLTRSLIGLGLMALLGLAAARLAGAALVLRPAKALLGATRRLAAGDLGARAEVSRRGGELGQLAEAFNAMAATLEARSAERDQAEEELRRLNAELEQRVAERTAELSALNHELEAFSYSVAHDLRAPLRAVDGFSEALLQDYQERLDAGGRDYLEWIRAAARRMAALIDDLLKLSRLSRAELSREQVDLSALARDLARELEAREPERRVELVVQEGIQARGDPRLLRVALEKLLENAWKFTAKRPHARVELGALEQDDGTVYYVRDDGAGFDMAYADKLFAPFQRLHAAGDFPGSGIGLATVQRIVHRHGGRVWATAAIDGGATFSFTLGEQVSPLQG